MLRCLLPLGLLLIHGTMSASFDPIEALDREANVLWTSPSVNSAGSMPIGNGDIGINAWMEESGDLLLLIGKSDSWSGNGRLLKLGKVRIKMDPSPQPSATSFSQLLNLKNGEILIDAGNGSDAVKLRIWVDAHHPVIQVEATSESPRDWTVDLEMWRTFPRVLEQPENHSAYGIYKGTSPIIVEPDTVVTHVADGITWYHRNSKSIWPDTLSVQSLYHWKETSTDPLLGRTFGGAIKADGFDKVHPMRLVSAAPRNDARIMIYPYTAQTESADTWLAALDGLVDTVTAVPTESRYAAHIGWWRSFWNRHWIFVSSEAEPSKAQAVNQGYALQRFMQACAGRGAFPIKFNGSLFTVDATSEFDADYRRWGGPYWWQNTRLPYFSMLRSGDFDLMDPLFDMYLAALPLARERVKTYYGHDGAYFPETMYFWGTWVNDDYGWDRAGKDLGRADSKYVRWEWQGGIELCWFMLQRYRASPDPVFLMEKLLPLARDIVDLYDQRYPRGANGKIVFTPSQALETYAEGTINPTPEIAGLHSLLSGLLSLHWSSTRQTDRLQWLRLLDELPSLPIRTMSGKTAFSPATVLGPLQNSESPELYPVFPYLQYGFGRPGLAVADWTYETRVNKRPDGWGQDVIIAAMLGRTDEAQSEVVRRFSKKHPGSRFPAMWGPNSDWIPDQCHGSVNMIALQKMLLQQVDKRIILFPAWPDDWDVDFRLYADADTRLDGSFVNGTLKSLSVAPFDRSRDVVVAIGSLPSAFTAQAPEVELLINGSIRVCFDRPIHATATYTLQQCADLQQSVWESVEGEATAINQGNGFNRVTFVLNNTGNQFFRLLMSEEQSP